MVGMSWLTETHSAVVLAIHAVPRASKNKIDGEHGGALKVRLQAPPVDGKANETLIAFFAERLGIARNRITLVSGQTGRRKRLALTGITATEVRTKLLDA